MVSDFQLAEILSATDTSAAEPKVPEIVGNQSFAFCQTTGNRDAPELLVLELFREVFFNPVSAELKKAELDPAAADFSRGEMAVLYAARGRLKLNRSGSGEGYFAPVYPEQARGGWLRRKSDRVLRYHLLQG